MPGKSGHAKGKHLPRSKRSRKLGLERQQSPAITTQQQSITPADKPAPVLTASAPSKGVPMPSVQYPHVGTELQRIGILTGIILVILVVLRLVLS